MKRSSTAGNRHALLPRDVSRSGPIHGDSGPAESFARPHPLWAAEEFGAGNLPAKAGRVLEAVLFRGESPRGDVAGLLGRIAARRDG